MSNWYLKKRVLHSLCIIKRSGNAVSIHLPWLSEGLQIFINTWFRDISWLLGKISLTHSNDLNFCQNNVHHRQNLTFLPNLSQNSSFRMAFSRQRAYEIKSILQLRVEIIFLIIRMWHSNNFICIILKKCIKLDADIFEEKDERTWVVNKWHKTQGTKKS